MKIIVLFILVTLSGCASNSLTRAAGEALLIGKNSSSLKVMIRTIDDGEVLWVGNYTLGTSATVAPGERKVNAMCEFKYSWGKKLVPGTININAKPDTDYKITGRLSKDKKSCDLSTGI